MTGAILEVGSGGPELFGCRGRCDGRFVEGVTGWGDGVDEGLGLLVGRFRELFGDGEGGHVGLQRDRGGGRVPDGGRDFGGGLVDLGGAGARAVSVHRDGDEGEEGEEAAGDRREEVAMPHEHILLRAVWSRPLRAGRRQQKPMSLVPVVTPFWGASII